MISIVIPAHNSAPFLGEALESVLAQSLQDFELIVVDDASTDNTWELIQSWKARFGNRLVAVAGRENKGPGGARNLGLGKAKGEFVAFLDSDDLWLPEHLAHAREAFQRHGETVGVFVGQGQMGGSNRSYHSLHDFTWPAPDPQPASHQLLSGCYFHLNSLCVRLTLLRELGGFREELICYEDWLLYLLLSKKTLFVHSPTVECVIRRRDGSVTTRGTQMSKPMYRDWIGAYLIAEQSGLWNTADLLTMRESFIAGRTRELADYLCGLSANRARWMLDALLQTGLRGRKVWQPIVCRGFRLFLARGFRKARKRLAFSSRLRTLSRLGRVLRETSACGMPFLRKVKCNICGWGGRKFADYDCGFGHIYRDAACPRCGSHPRHRSLHLHLQRTIPTAKPLRLLHFAPEPSLTALLRSYANVDYLSVDVNPAQAMQQEDITGLSFRDESFDVIICIHVLEHIEDDRKAMSEILRVLKSGGVAVLDVPIDYGREKTYEDPSIRSPEERTKAFWQSDHVRLYGRDFTRRLEEAGFAVQADQYITSLGEEFIRFHGLRPTPFFLCTRK